MTPDRWQRLKEIFNDALELAPGRREAFVREATHGDTQLASEVFRLLEEAETQSGLLSRPALDDGFSASAAALLSPGTIMARRFRILRFLAQGGMGQVYEAEDLELGGRVALKTIHRAVSAQRELLTLFRNEIQLARRVTHPNVCRIFDIVQHASADEGGAATLLSMELIEGHTLAEHLKLEGPFSPADALPFVEEIAAGLQAVHDAGIIHGDLKPGNIMLANRPGDTRPRAVVMDFGMALRAMPEAPNARGGRGGTPAYSAPEQIRGEPLTPASDIYSLALVISEMLGVPRPARLKPGRERMPSEWCRVLQRCLDSEPARRCSRPGDLAGALRSSANSRRRVVFRAAFACAVAVALGTAMLWLPARNQPGTADNRLLFEEGDELTVRSASPDGRSLAVTSWDTGDLAVRDVRTGQMRRLTHADSNHGQYHGAQNAVFSHDGRRIAYLWSTSRTTGDLRVIGAEGRGERSIYTDSRNLAFPLDWSPDNTRILVGLRGTDSTLRLALIAAADGSSQLLNVPALPVANAVFTPDGRSIVYDRRTAVNGPSELRLAPLAGGDRALAVGPGSNSVVGWTPDGKRLLFMTDRRGTPGLWAVGFTGTAVVGEPEEILPDATRWEPLAMTASGALYYRHAADSTDVYTATVDLVAARTIDPPHRVTDRYIGSYSYPSWSQDGSRLVFGSYHDHRFSLVIYDVATRTTKEWPEAFDYLWRPQWVAHSTEIVAPGSLNGREGLYRIAPGTGRPALLIGAAELGSKLEGAWSADGALHFNRYTNHRRGIFSLDMRTRERRTLYVPPEGVDVATENLSLSPDGKTLAFHARNDAEQTGSLMLMSSGGGPAQPLLTVRKPESFLFGAFTWSPDSRTILAARTRHNRVSEIWEIPIDGSAPRKIDFPAMRIVCLRLSRDGKTLAFMAGGWRSEIWMLQNFTIPRPATP